MSYKLVIAEKPSVAQAIAKVIGADKKEDGYLEGNGYIVSWCVGHLVELASPESYDEKYEKNMKSGDMRIFQSCHRNGITRLQKQPESSLEF